ncbi:hypothetical protein HNR23_004393 [Nocardiopsis mwathae]|uniref:Uncharacterized protein n=1 Tax=Nocardiopsis mwathae TaxID=1472723 RepID=A0A7X0D7D2_9ACTN|nr:hypothetical protein [Nocardiopsis mwathae]MBB6174333.1 hypothetical protein [Nocardiopsis mwathae]
MHSGTALEGYDYEISIELRGFPDASYDELDGIGFREFEKISELGLPASYLVRDDQLHSSYLPGRGIRRFVPTVAVEDEKAREEVADQLKRARSPLPQTSLGTDVFLRIYSVGEAVAVERISQDKGEATLLPLCFIRRDLVTADLLGAVVCQTASRSHLERYPRKSFKETSELLLSVVGETAEDLSRNTECLLVQIRGGEITVFDIPVSVEGEEFALPRLIQREAPLQRSTLPAATAEVGDLLLSALERIRG